MLSRLIALLVVAVVLVAGVLFSIQNTATVPLDLLVIQFSEQRIALWVLSAFAIGGLTGMSLSLYAFIRLKGHNLILHRKLERSNKELDKLRSQGPHLPVTKS